MLLPALLTLAIVALALLFGATVYESVVMAPNFERDIPDSIALARRFLQRRTPAHFFRPLAPLAQLLLLACLIAAWPEPATRWPAVLGLGAIVVADVITFTYHYPRLAVMFKASEPQDPSVLRGAARGWARGNLVRAVLLLIALLATIHGLAEAREAIGRLTAG